MARHESRPRRARRRLSLRFWPLGKPERSRPGFTEDLSDTGVFIQTTTPYGPGATLEIEFESKDGPILARGRIIWAKRAPATLAQNKRSGMGIRLTNVPEALLELAGLT